MSENNDNKNNTEMPIPDMGNIFRTLLEQVTSQAGPSSRRRRNVRFSEDRKTDDDDHESSEDPEDDEDQGDEEGDEETVDKWEILADLAESHKLLCRAFSDLMENSE